MLFEQVRGFLVRVGLVTTAIVVTLLFFNLMFWHYQELYCVNGSGALGLATKYPDRIETQVGELDRPIFTKDVAHDTPMLCGVLFGEGWKNVDR